MSIAFSDTTNKDGLVQHYEAELDLEDGRVSGNATLLKRFTAQANLALDRLTFLMLKHSGRWQWDDSNHGDYPILTTAIVDGQRDYSFIDDEDGNLILDIFRVYAIQSADSSEYVELGKVDLQAGGSQAADINNGLELEGVPNNYDKTGNGIILDVIPNYGKAAGLKLIVNREASYFASSDTTKLAGIPGIFHDYLFLFPARNYARVKNLESYPRLRDEVQAIEDRIPSYFGSRARDESPNVFRPCPVEKE